MTITAGPQIGFSNITNEVYGVAAYSTDLNFLNNLILPSQRPSTPKLSNFYSLSYYQNNKNGNCNNTNCQCNNCNCGQCNCNPVNCNAINCANCDTQDWLQSGTNCFTGTYNCTTYNCFTQGSNCSKIVCGKLYEYGLMSQNIWAADQAYGRELRKTDKNVYRGYFRWARPVTQWMDGKGPDFMLWVPKNKRAQAQQNLMIGLTHKVGSPWSEHMAYKMGAIKNDNEHGRILMKIGRFFCKAVNFIPKMPTKYKNSKYTIPYSLLSSYTIWFLLEFSYYTTLAYMNLNKLIDELTHKKEIKGQQNV